MEDFREIRSRIVLTKHAKENLYGIRNDCDRTDISLNDVARTIKLGRLGFAGSRRYIKTYKGICVLYKIDNNDPQRPLYVVITYYRKRKFNKYKNNRKKVLTY